MGNYYETELKFTYSIQEAFERAVTILDFLEWNYRINGVNLIIARTSVSAFGWGEEVTISIEQHRMTISSESRYPFQLFDLGKNESNVDKFKGIFRRAKLPFNADDFPDEKPRSLIGRFLSGR